LRNEQVIECEVGEEKKDQTVNGCHFDLSSSEKEGDKSCYQYPDNQPNIIDASDLVMGIMVKQHQAE
jgi:hypothetical protein